MIDKTLIDAVIEQMTLDIESQDWTAIAELLTRTPEDALVAFLSNCGMPEVQEELETESGEDLAQFYGPSAR
jgi:hypothetical protein